MEEGWLCVEGCPVLELGRQSGQVRAGGHINHSKAGHDNASHSYGNGFIAAAEPGVNTYSDKGTAARFFMQFGEEDNLIEPVQEVEASARIIQGDCVEEMAKMAESSIDSIVCDPPYGLNFMNKDFDKLGKSKAMQAWHEVWAREALRVLKPGGYLLAFGGTRTVHRLACAIEDAGFEIRDRYLHLNGGGAIESIPGEIAWVYGSG